MTKGIITNWIDDRGFGFLKVEGEPKEIFFHMTALVDARYEPDKGDHVEFAEIVDGAKGPRATGVKLIERKTPGYGR